jgi:hypothetical protein
MDLLALRAGIVGADRLDGVAIAARACLGDDDAVVRLVRCTDAGEADLECHEGRISDGFDLEKGLITPPGPRHVKRLPPGVVS